VTPLSATGGPGHDERRAPTAALIDVGGTLWSERPTIRDPLARAPAVSKALPGTPTDMVNDLVITIVARVEDDTLTDQRRHAVDHVRRVLVDHGLPSDEATVARVRRALCEPLRFLVPAFDGAGELLAGVRELGMRCVILSNTTFRDAEVYRSDFCTLGWDKWIDGCTTSVDAGCGKPDRRIFELAVHTAGVPASSCVMIGNSEDKDVLPALKLGMRALRVALEGEVPQSSAADAVVTSLHRALATLRSWVRGD
jgi:FMN phosphatase YigB (HAD superfamily)